MPTVLEIHRTGDGRERFSSRARSVDSVLWVNNLPKDLKISKRLLLANILQRFGVIRTIEMFRARAGVLVINHHRVGDANLSRFDQGVFSATTEQLDRQTKYLKQHFPVVCGDELEELVTGRKKLTRLYVSITFDDGYLDNFTHAFDVLRSNNCPASFFLVPEYVGTNSVPWWDAIAYLIRNTEKKEISLRLPAPLTLTLGADREPAILAALLHYKRADNMDGDQFMAELQDATECVIPDPGRRFLNWSEAKEMKNGGMTIGSHTNSHRILGQLSLDSQRGELEQSKRILEEQLGVDVSTLAYPVGSATAFNQSTEEIARELGYKMCFSFYGGINMPGAIRQTDILRTGMPTEFSLFRTETALLTHLGKLPY
jgi:peptidoglycan/xylan/chitin deacetylase (PgdA/CDA1 family)